MKTSYILFIFLALISSCSRLTRQERIFECMEKIHEMGGDTTSSYEICKDMLANRPLSKEDRERGNK